MLSPTHFDQVEIFATRAQVINALAPLLRLQYSSILSKFQSLVNYSPTQVNAAGKNRCNKMQPLFLLFLCCDVLPQTTTFSIEKLVVH